MTHFDSGGEAQNQEMETGLKLLEDNFLEGHLADQSEYFVGRFTLTQEMNVASFPLAQHIGKEIGITNSPNTIIIKPSRDPNYVKVYLTSKGIESHLKQPQKEVQETISSHAEIPDSLNELCNRINVVMINFNQATSKTQYDEQQNGLKKIKENYIFNKNNDQNRYFIGRFSTDREDLNRLISEKRSNIPKESDEHTAWGFMPQPLRVKVMTKITIGNYIAEQIGFGLTGDDLEIEESSAANMVKVSLNSSAIKKCAEYVPSISELKL